MKPVVRFGLAVLFLAVLVGLAPAQVRIVNVSRQDIHVATFVSQLAKPDAEPMKGVKPAPEGFLYTGWSVIPFGSSKEFPAGHYFLKSGLMPIVFNNVQTVNGLINPKGDFKIFLSKSKFMQDYQNALFTGAVPAAYMQLDKGNFTHGSDFRVDSQTFSFGFSSAKKMTHKRSFSVTGRVLYYEVKDDKPMARDDTPPAFTWTQDKGQVNVTGTTEPTSSKNKTKTKTTNPSIYTGQVIVYYIR